MVHPRYTKNTCHGKQADVPEASRKAMWDTSDYGTLGKLVDGMTVLCEPDPKVWAEAVACEPCWAR